MKKMPKQSIGWPIAFGKPNSGTNPFVVVIPFLRVRDFKQTFSAKANEMLQEHELHKKQVQALRLLEQKEGQLHQNIILINEMRRVILKKYRTK
jgi:hypothetical protein